MTLSPQTMSVEDRRLVAIWAADCAADVLAIFENSSPGDPRVRAAIELIRSFARGELDVAEAIRSRGADAGAAARDASTPGARAAAYAAEQAAAVAHMGAHALGAAGYAAKATTIAAQGTDVVAMRSHAHRQVALMTPEVARAIASLPTLGSDRAGPLGPGRLATGHVGEAIRAIQSLLEADSEALEACRIEGD